MKAKVALWGAVMTGAAIILLGTSSSADLFHPSPPPRPEPPGTAAVAIGSFICSQPVGGTQGFPALTISGTTSIGSLFMGGPFSTEAGSVTPVTCAGLAQQASADAAAGGCKVGPIGAIGAPRNGEIGVQFSCSGPHDSVIAAIGTISGSLALVLLPASFD
jgi:hypothetical protein